MDNGFQAVAARINTVEQRFAAGTGSASAGSADGVAASSFAAVLAATLDQRSLSSSLGGQDQGSTMMDPSLLAGPGSGADPLGSTQGLSSFALLALLGAVARSAQGRAGSGTSAYRGVGSVGSVGSGTNSGSVAAGGGALTPATRLTPGAYGKLTPPAELVGYGNGRIPSDRLESIGVGSHKLHAPAATAYRRMTADAAAQGVDIGITDSYRSYDSQVELAGRKGLYSQGGLAASPGTSNHGWGLAVDLDLDATAQQWMRDNAQRYGFVEDTPREPWHWGYRPAV